MTRLSTAALLAAGIFVIYSAPSFAAATTPPRNPNPPCTINCGGDGGEPTSPGDPFNPNFPDPDPEDGSTPDDPDKDPGDPDKDPGDPDKDPGDPDKDPGNPGDPNDPGKNPNDPGKQASAELRKCLARLDDLPQVSASAIDKFGQPHKVSLTPICEITSLTDVQPVLIEGGNVAGLEPALRSNELIRGKLGQTAYKARDVVGIDFDDKGNAILLVHRRG